jgi:hypothetical protein
MLKDQRDLVALFNAHGVKYLVVGAHAVGVHAEPRGTKDLDILIQADPDNSEAVFAALAEFGAPLAGMSPADFNDAPGSVFQIGVPPSRIDILQKIEAVTFEEAWANRIETSIDQGIPTNVISRDDLIRNKLAVNRMQDVLDVEKIREAEQVRLGKKPPRDEPGEI